MKKVFLHGKLGNKFGREWDLEVESLQEMLVAIDANKDGFMEYMIKESQGGNNFAFLTKKPEEINKDDDLTECFIPESDVFIKNKFEEIHVVSSAQGGILDWLVAFGKWFFSAEVLFQVALMTAVSYTIAELTKPPDPPKPKDNTISTKSYLLSGSQNRAAQGVALPVGYGQLVIGSSNVGEYESVFRKRSSDSKMSLESYVITKKLDILCEGPIEGFTDSSGNVIREVDADFNEGEKYQKALYLNDVVVKNENDTFNFVLSEDNNRRAIDIKKGGQNETKLIWNEGGRGFVNYIKRYNTLLYGPSPYIKTKESENSSGVETAFYEQESKFVDKVSFAVNDGGAKVFSHLISNPCVNHFSVTMAAELSTTNSDKSDQSLRDGIYGRTEYNECFFMILVKRSFGEFNVLDEERSGVRFVPGDDTLPTDEAGLKKAYSLYSDAKSNYINSGSMGKIYENLISNSSTEISSISVNEKIQRESQAFFGYNAWRVLKDTDEASGLRATPTTLYDGFLGLSLPELTQSTFEEAYSSEQKKIFKLFVQKNKSILDAYNTRMIGGMFFKIRGIATAPYEFQLNFDVLIPFTDVEKQQGITVKIIKYSPETDPGTDKAEYINVSPTQLGTNRVVGFTIGGMYQRRSLVLKNIQERISANLTYPNTAMASVEIDSRNFNSEPTRGYGLKLKRVLVPSNYNSVTRKYEGAWNGLFLGQENQNKSVGSIDDEYRRWSDNPAWVFYDIVTNNRYGAGKFGITEKNIDKWQLYKAAKYCDELVKTGYSPQTKTELLRAFSTSNLINSYMSAEGGGKEVEIDIESYFWSKGLGLNDSGDSGNLNFTDNNFFEYDYLPENLSDVKDFEAYVDSYPTDLPAAFEADTRGLTKEQWGRDHHLTYGDRTVTTLKAPSRSTYLFDAYNESTKANVLIDEVCSEMLGRNASEGERESWSNYDWTVENLIDHLINEYPNGEPLAGGGFSEKDFINEFGDGEK